MLANVELREKMIEVGVAQWQLARIVGCAEGTLSRKLRTELPPKAKEAAMSILSAIENDEAPSQKDISRFRSSQVKRSPHHVAVARNIDRIMNEVEDRRRTEGWGW